MTIGLQHLGNHVDAHGFPLGSNHDGSEKSVHSTPTANVQDCLALMNSAQGEGVPYTAVRSNDGFWEGTYNSRIIIQGLKARPTGWVPEKAFWIDGDLSIFLLEALLYPFSIFSR